jgi:hypothetical protein
MNLVSAVGGTKKQRELAEDVAYFCIEELLPRHRTLDIELCLNKCGDMGASGFCYAVETERDFTVEVDKRIYKVDLDEFIVTLCHEMVHVMQTAKGMLTDRIYPRKLGYRRLWKGKDHTKTSYSKQPWERQAYRMQNKLAKKYKEKKCLT